MYNKRIWLNEDGSHFTASMVCFDGKVKAGNEMLESAFIEITDCYHKIRLHVGDEYNYQNYINKIEKMVDELIAYKDYLKATKVSQST